jgi:hypothetical protein
VRQVDAAGNRSEPTGATVAVDTAPPGPATIGKRPPAVTTDTTAEIAFSGEASARWVCQIDGDFRPDRRSPIRLSGLALGEHVVKILQIDRYSNGGDWLPITWTVKAPDKPTVQPPARDERHGRRPCREPPRRRDDHQVTTLNTCACDPSGSRRT